MPPNAFVRAILLWSALLCAFSGLESSEVDHTSTLHEGHHSQGRSNATSGEWNVREADLAHIDSAATRSLASTISEVSKCNLKEETLLRLYDSTHKTWLLDDSALQEIGNDIQAVIECASVNDILQLSSNQTIKPSRTLSITFPIKLETFFQADKSKQEESTQKDLRATLTCPGQGSLLSITTPEFTMSNLRISNCTRSKSSSISLNVFNCSRNVQDSRILFESVEFSHLIMSNGSRILQDISTVCGYVEFKDIEIRDNSCYDGGCFLLPRQSHIASTSIIKNENADNSPDNTVFKIPSGSELQVENIIATNNSIRMFYMDLKAKLDIRGSFFEGNIEWKTQYASKLVGGGTVIFAREARMVSISNTSFIGNVAGLAGGALFVMYTPMSIENCTFANNTATNYYGGAIHSVGAVQLNISTSVFEGNKAGSDGAAINLRQSSRVAIHLCRFANNTTPWKGGDIFIHDNVTLLLTDSTLTGSSAEQGGSISISLESIGEIRGSRFEKGKAFSEGGAIYVAEQSELCVYDSSFSRNMARRHGGALRVSHESHLSIIHCEFVHNRVEEFDSNGGAISVPYLGKLVLEDSYFSGNSAQNGGSIYLREATEATIKECTFEDNSASSDGGVIAMVSNTTLLISRSRFSKNKGEDAGVLYAQRDCNVTIMDSIVEDNSADSSGAGLYLRSHAKLFLSNTTFIGNVGEKGGAISLSMLSVGCIENCTFVSNEGRTLGGAIMTSQEVSLTINRSMFNENKARTGGALATDGDNDLTIILCSLTNNTATDGGAIHISQSSRFQPANSSATGSRGSVGAVAHGAYTNITSIEQCVFEDNIATHKGGALRIERNSALFVTSSNFTRNIAGFDGGVISSCTSNVTMQFTTMKFNEAKSGGSVHGNHSFIKIAYSTFQRNRAYKLGGFLSVNASRVELKSIETSLNRANLTGGGIFADLESVLFGSYFTVSFNSAKRAGGGVALIGGSSFLCYACLFENNTASTGAGLYIRTIKERRLAYAQLQDCKFLHNSASYIGGGLVFEGHQNQHQNRSQEDESYGRIILLSTSFVHNYARDLGATILSTNAKDVLVLCSYGGSRRSHFLDPDDLIGLEPINPKELCESWKENHIVGSRTEGVVGTFGKKLSLSINSTNASTDVHLTGNETVGFTLESVASGEKLPEIKVVVLDAFGNGPAPTIPRSMLANIMSPDGFFQGVMTFSIVDGYGQFEGIVGVKSPGYYTIKITPQISSIDESILKIHVRKCHIGEQPTIDGKLCETCDGFSYNFNVDKPGGCTHCPEGSRCEGHYIVPMDGYWHKGPCYNKVKECINEEACKYETRHEALVNFTKNLNNCTMNTTTLETYNDVQCNEGYKGSLCGSCKKYYGLSSDLECLKCGFVLFSILRVVAIIVYLLVGTSLTIRATLPILSRRLFRQHAMTPLLAASSSALIEARAKTREGETTQEEDSVHQASTRHEQVSLSRVVSRRAASVALVQDNVTETWKILLNFVQVNSTAVALNVKWPEKIRGFFKILNILGATTINSISRPIDCIVASSSVVARVIWRYVFCLFVPIVVIAILSIYWGYRSLTRHKAERLYFMKRFILIVITVTYITYFDITQLVVRVFNCVAIYDNDDPFSNSFTRYWVPDTSIECYKSTHAILVGISIFVLITVSVCFPLACSFALLKARNEIRVHTSMAHEMLGVLCGPFKARFIYWECVTMIKKGLLSIVLVFSYSLDKQAQGLLLSLILVFFLSLHSTCYPFKEEFNSLNYYEIGSLLTSCATYIIVQFFNVESASNTTRSVISVSLIILNGCYVSFIVFHLVKNLVSLAKNMMLADNVMIPDDISWISILKLYYQHKRARRQNA